jgi:predicted RNase H-like HicB family nuclease
VKREWELRGELPFALTREGAWTVATCPVLDVASQGKTPKSAERNLIKAVQLFLRDCLESMTLDRALREAGLVQVELAGVVYWVANIPNRRQGFHTLKIRMRAATNEAFRRPSSRRVHLPTVLPWLIRADIHDQARAS